MDSATTKIGPVWVVAAIVVLAVVAAVVYVQTRDDRPTVLLVGDSITEISAKPLTDQMKSQYRILASGAPQRRADERVRDLPLLVATNPAGVVINLGTNDVIQHQSRDITMRSIDKIGTAFRKAQCVILVTVSEDMYSVADSQLRPNAAALNRRIRALAARRHWGVVRWDVIVHRYIAEGEKLGPLTVDTIHPRPIGKRLLGDAYGRALAPCFAN